MADSKTYTPRLKTKYEDEIVPELKKVLGTNNPMAVPRLEKIVINMGVGRAVENKKALEAAVADLKLICGQKPVISKARRSVSNFKLRQGMDIGCKVTLRRSRMYEMLDRLINVVVPRIRDFRGLGNKSFDGRGNYAFGLAEQSVFPEVDLDKLELQQGMDICIVTTAKTDADAHELLKQFGFPFKRPKTDAQ